MFPILKYLKNHLFIILKMINFKKILKLKIFFTILKI